MNIKEFENVMFDILPISNKDTYKIKYVDFSGSDEELKNYSRLSKLSIILDGKELDVSPELDINPETNDTNFPNIIGPTSWKKVGNMIPFLVDEKIDIEIAKTLLMENIRNVFLKKAVYLGELNRIHHDEFTPSPDKFDLNIPEFRKKDLVIKKMDENRVVLEKYNQIESITRRIIPQLNRCGSWIATNGRIGPGIYLLMNNDTYKYLEPYFSLIGNFYKKEQFDEFYKVYINRERNINFDKDVKAKLQGFEIITDDRLNDDIIIQGRKNGSHIFGLLTLIWCDEDGNILYEAKENGIEFKYNVIDIGFRSWTQFYSIHLKR